MTTNIHLITNNLRLFLSIFTFILVIVILIYVGVIILNEQMKPFKDCQNKTNDTIIELGGKNITCGVINNITTMESGL